MHVLTRRNILGNLPKKYIIKWIPLNAVAVTLVIKYDGLGLGGPSGGVTPGTDISGFWRRCWMGSVLPHGSKWLIAPPTPGRLPGPGAAKEKAGGG